MAKPFRARIGRRIVFLTPHLFAYPGRNRLSPALQGGPGTYNASLVVVSVGAVAEVVGHVPCSSDLVVRFDVPYPRAVESDLYTVGRFGIAGLPVDTPKPAREVPPPEVVRERRAARKLAHKQRHAVWRVRQILHTVEVFGAGTWSDVMERRNQERLEGLTPEMAAAFVVLWGERWGPMRMGATRVPLATRGGDRRSLSLAEVRTDVRRASVPLVVEMLRWLRTHGVTIKDPEWFVSFITLEHGD